MGQVTAHLQNWDEVPLPETHGLMKVDTTRNRKVGASGMVEYSHQKLLAG